MLLISLLVPIANRTGLVDTPDARKRHQGTVPLVGGIAVCLSMGLVLLYLGELNTYAVMLFCAFALMILGVADDAKDIDPGLKMLGQVTVAIFFTYFAGIQIEQIGDLTNSGKVLALGILSIPFTIACMIGVINAINMIDGLDALATSLVMMTVSAMILLAILVDRTSDVLVLFVLLGALGGVLVFNSRLFFPRARIFLGDAGSMLLGLLLVWFFIVLSQSANPAFSAVSAGWLFGLPLVDTVSVIIGRLRKQQSPFTAGRDHLHYRLQEAGVSYRGVIVAMVLLHGLFISIGMVCAHSLGAQPVLFWGFVLFVIVYHFWSKDAIALLSRMTSPVAG